MGCWSEGPLGLDSLDKLFFKGRWAWSWSLADERFYRCLLGLILEVGWFVDPEAVGAWFWKMDEWRTKNDEWWTMNELQGAFGLDPWRMDVWIPGPSGLDLGRWMNVASRAVGAWSWRTMNDERRTKNEERRTKNELQRILFQFGSREMYLWIGELKWMKLASIYRIFQGLILNIISQMK